VAFWFFENFYTPATYVNTGGTPQGSTTLKEEFLPGSTTGAVVHHTYYSLSYHETYEQAEWVFYQLHSAQLTNEDRKRPYFIEDPYVATKSADWKNYRGSGYDRGHLCPAGDRRFSEQAYNETFYTSNIAPQYKDFNAGVWNRLEQHIRSWARRYGAVYVITGGVLEENLPAIGEEEVSVPQYFYKIVAKEEDEKVTAIAFLIKHEENTAPLTKFVVPIDRLEMLTGIDFFQNMPLSIQRPLEKNSTLHHWKF
jgi:endonuclease G